MLRRDLITVLNLLKRDGGEDDTDLPVASISTRGEQAAQRRDHGTKPARAHGSIGTALSHTSYC